MSRGRTRGGHMTTAEVIRRFALVIGVCAAVGLAIGAYVAATSNEPRKCPDNLSALRSGLTAAEVGTGGWIVHVTVGLGIGNAEGPMYPLVQTLEGGFSQVGACYPAAFWATDVAIAQNASFPDAELLIDASPIASGGGQPPPRDEPVLILKVTEGNLAVYLVPVAKTNRELASLIRAVPHHLVSGQVITVSVGGTVGATGVYAVGYVGRA